MPFQLQIPLEKEFTLEKTDKAFKISKEDPTKVIIRQATQRAHERRASLFATVARELDRRDNDIVRLVSKYSFEELKRIETYLTLVSCNIKDIEGKSLFKFNADGQISEQDFNEAWSRLPPSVADEIHECVIQVNVDWNPLVGEDSLGMN